MHALLMVQGLLEVVGLFKTTWAETIEAEGVAVMLLGMYPSESLANKVRDKLVTDFGFGDGSYRCEPDTVLAFMRNYTPPVRMSRREAKRTRATIAAALEIIDDEAQRRKDMPF